jgi:hypothetical protein
VKPGCPLTTGLGVVLVAVGNEGLIAHGQRVLYIANQS